MNVTVPPEPVIYHTALIIVETVVKNEQFYQVYKVLTLKAHSG